MRLEDERRAAQAQKAAEQQANEAKQQALKEAAEQRKAEAIRRNEQSRLQAQNNRTRQMEDSVSPAQSFGQFRPPLMLVYSRESSRTTSHFHRQPNHQQLDLCRAWQAPPNLLEPRCLILILQKL